MAQFPKGEPAPADGLIPLQAAISSIDKTFHAYVHVPYCKARCGYCDFNTYTAEESVHLLKELLLKLLSKRLLSLKRF